VDLDPKVARDDVNEVWQHYRTYHPRTTIRLKADRKEHRLIRARLSDFAVDDLRQAIDGYHGSDWHTGQNERGKKYLSLELMMRDISHVQAGIEMAEARQQKQQTRLLDDSILPSDIEH
jgi:hypothetical protein